MDCSYILVFVYDTHVILVSTDIQSIDLGDGWVYGNMI